MTKCCDNQELTEGIRGAIKARATWFYLLLQAMKEENVDFDGIARKAIFKAGQLNNVKMGMCNTPREFFDALATKNTSLAFDMEEIKVDEQQGVYRFHKCALCDAWKELGCSQEEIDHLCKIATEGDYGIMSAYPLDMKFNCTIGDGSKYCEMVVTQK